MLSYFIPKYARFVLMIIAFYIYYHTYEKISLGIIPVLIFPSFYIAYTIFKYPENLNWKGEPVIPDEDGFISELNELISNPYATMIIFIPVYMIISVGLYKKKFKNIAQKLYKYVS
jgi:hypothetical protein